MDSHSRRAVSSSEKEAAASTAASSSRIHANPSEHRRLVESAVSTSGHSVTGGIDLKSDIRTANRKPLGSMQRDLYAAGAPEVVHSNRELLTASVDGMLSGDRHDRGLESRLHTRIDEVARERNNYQELLRSAVARIFELETRLQLEETHPEVQLLQEKAIEIHRRSKATITAMNADIADLKLLYRTEKNAKDSLRLQLVAAQKELELAKSTMKMQESSLNDSENAIRKLSDENFELQQALATAETTLSALKQERKIKLKDSQYSTERSLIMAQKCEDLEKRNLDLTTQLESAVASCDKAVHSRDQLSARLREATQEVENLREQERRTYNELVEKSKRDLLQLRQTSDEVVRQLREDVVILETKLTEKDIELNRALRETKSQSMQIDRLERDALASLTRDPSTSDDLFRRLISAEQERDRLAILVESTQTTLRQKLDEMNDKEARFEKSMKEQNVRLKETVERYEALSKEHVGMAEEIQRLQKEIAIKEKAIHHLNKEIQSEIATFKEKAKQEEAEKLARSTAMEESQRQSLLDMQQVNKLLRQQIAHWQAEFNNLQNTNESLVRDLKDRLTKAKVRYQQNLQAILLDLHLQTRQYELETDLQRASALNAEMMKRMEEVKAAMVSMKMV